MTRRLRALALGALAGAAAATGLTTIMTPAPVEPKPTAVVAVAPAAGDRLLGAHLDVRLVATTTAVPYDHEHATIVTNAPVPAGVTWIGGHTIGPVFDGLHLLVRGDGLAIGSTFYRVAALHDFEPVAFRQPSSARTTVILQTCDDAGPHGEPNPAGRWELYVELTPAR